MQNQVDYLLVVSTCPDHLIAKDLASNIVERRLAACVNILPNIISVYQWQGRQEQSDECLMLMKTTKQQYADLQRFIVDKHPYELPEVIAVPISDGLPDYLAWIGNAINEKQ